jgi:ferredoxin-nitrite reductase
MNLSQQRYLEGFFAGVSAYGRLRGNPPAEPRLIPFRGLAEQDSANGSSVTGEEGASFEEQVKRELHPLDSFPKLLENAENNQPPDRADRFRFQWFGLFCLAPEKDGFMLRVRVPGGQLQAFQLRGLAGIAQEFANGSVEINPWAGLDLRIVTAREAPEALRRLETLGLSARGSGGDCVRAVTRDALEGFAAPALLDAQPLVCQLEQLVTHSREFYQLPRGCVILFRGAGERLHAPDDGDAIILQAIEKAPGEAAFRVRISGENGHLGVMVRPEQAVRFCMELLRAWTRGSDRADREGASLAKYVERIGHAALLEELAGRLPFKLARAAIPESVVAVAPPDFLEACQPGPAGHNALAVKLPAPRLLSGQLTALARLAETHGAGEVRLAPQPALVLPGVPDADLSAARKALWNVSRAESGDF